MPKSPLNNLAEELDMSRAGWVVIALLVGVTPAPGQQPSLGDRINNTERQLRRAVACVDSQATKLAASAEASDVAARAAVALCGNELVAYRSAVASAVGSQDADQVHSQLRRSLIERALARIVVQRQHQQPAAKAQKPNEI